MVNSSKLELIIFEIWNLKGGAKMTVLELSNEEANTLIGILKVEKSDLEELIQQEGNPNDKKGLEQELERVNSILEKLYAV